MDNSLSRFSLVPGFDAASLGDSESQPTPEERRRFTFLTEVPILRDIHEDVLWSLARAARDEHYEDDTLIVKQGEQGSDGRFFLVREGAVDVVMVDEQGQEDVVACLTQGDYFGKLALLANAHRAATIRAAGTVNVVSFDGKTFLGVIAQHVLVFRMVGAQRRSDALQVRELGLFSDMPLHELTRLLHDAEQRFCPEASEIVTQGDPGDRFYVILDGTVSIERDGTPIAELGNGDFFGETALLFDVARTATVRAIRPTMVWSLGRESFQAVVRHYLLGGRRTRDTVARRLNRLTG